jgi:hypothetical protein
MKVLKWVFVVVWVWAVVALVVDVFDFMDGAPVLGAALLHLVILGIGVGGNVWVMRRLNPHQ